ncbi:hypothetical protein, partial [Shewanella colwelliana]|uniref:hypothetical protein n=1 Tax=Shewanella colwelliana TaxID=23 RepID=UPI001C7E03C1
MSKCYVINSLDYEGVRNFKHHLRFKYQNIFKPCVNSVHDKSENVIGAEILIDFNHLRAINLPEEKVKNLIVLGEAAHKSIDTATHFFGKSTVFVNVERINLCDMKILRRLITLNKRLFLMGVEFVVEITERTPCG